MPFAIGIDLGTTNSKASVCQRGEPETIPIDGHPTMPSVVSFDQDGKPIVGRPAKARVLAYPEVTVSSAKRFMGDRSKTYRLGRKTLTPVEVGTLVLKRLVEGCKQALGEEVRDVVITVPAYFNEAQREDTRRAGEKAGLNVLRLLPEPTAAAIAYGLNKGKDQTIMVYDLGGGTFDVSILTVKGNEFHVRAVGGDSRLGGDDFDAAVMAWASEKFKAQTGIDLLWDTSRQGMTARQRLLEACEAAKIELAASDRAVIAVPDCMGHPLELELTLAEYNRLIATLLQKTIKCMKATLKDARLTPSDIDRVILVGGSTKNRAVREVVAREIKEPYVADRVDEAVTHGAAIVAASLFLPDEDLRPIDVDDIKERTPHSLGIDVLNERNKLVFRPIIPRQSEYPCRFGFLGSTNRGMQDEVVMAVFRGESTDPSENTRLGELALPVSPRQPNLVPIAAIFQLDANGIVHFTAVQLPTGPAILPLAQYAEQNNGALDLAGVDPLIANGSARTKTVEIRIQ